MQLAALIDPGAQEVLELSVEAIVTQGGPEVDFGITGIALAVRGRGLPRTEEQFVELAQTASVVCPVGRALSEEPISIDAALNA